MMTNDNFQVEEVKGFTKGIVDELICLEEKCCPLEMRKADAYRYFLKTLNDPGAISLLLKSSDKVIGFLSARKYKNVYQDLANHDPDLKQDKSNYYYIEYVQINPRYKRYKSGLKMLFGCLFSKATEKKLHGLCMHVRAKNGLSGQIKNCFNGQMIRSIDNWLGFNESFDYIELAVNSK